jgi:hypothetical protein
MSRSIEEIRGAVELLVDRWAAFKGTERSASQTFLNQLVAAYTGAPDAMAAGATFEEFGDRDDGMGYMDLYWRDVAIIEMKAPSQSRRLDQHRAQVLDYWRNSSNVALGIEAPRHLVLCSFQNFEVWEPGRFPTMPVDVFTLEELPDRIESLLFLAGRQPLYGGAGAAVTQEAAAHMVGLYFSLLERQAVPEQELRRFIMQTVWALFAEDIGILEGRPVETLVSSLLADSTRSSATELADLYERMNTQDAGQRNLGRQTPLPYVNGDLFAMPARVHLEPSELRHLLTAAKFDWRQLYPTIFGSLLEGCLGHNRRWELGAHYTSEIDIMTIIEPVIIRPWVRRIEATTNFKQAQKLLSELCKFKVLDPAMGCGNFLAVAYREIRRLEMRLHDQIVEFAYAEGRVAPMEMNHYPIRNIQGIEIDETAVAIARTTLWMTHAIEARRYESGDKVLPLPSLDSLYCADSLKTKWPETDCVIGNPPFHGDRNLRSVVGDEYIDWLKDEFGVGVKDHCVYFFLKTHRALRPGQRAGLVATKTISQTKNRDASLAQIANSGGVITDAVSTQVWSGEANVHVSIVCWQKEPISDSFRMLDGKSVEGITPSLTAGSVHREAIKLKGNKAVCFQGFLPNGMGFVLEEAEKDTLLARPEANYSEVVYRFMNGEDLVSTTRQEPTRWIIDFGNRSLEEASKYPAALQIVRDHVKPLRDQVSRKAQRERWWQFAETRPGIMKALPSLNRVGLVGLTAKRLLLVWGNTTWRPSHACGVYTFDDDYSFGICSSRVHEIWARANSSTLEDRLRYTPSIAFETFPFPNPSDGQREAIASASRSIVELRRRYCDELQKGLTALYNLVDDGGAIELGEAHTQLDHAVLDAYGWDRDLLESPDKLLDLLFDLNEACTQDSAYDPFGKLRDASAAPLDLG